MLEIDFLPNWYGDMHRRRHRLRVQVGLSVGVALLLLGWTMLIERRVAEGHKILAERDVALTESEQRVQQRAIQQQLRDQLRNQDRVESSLGLNVEASRVLALLSNALPPAASITELSIDTDEHQRPLLQQVVSKLSTPAIPDRRLVVTSKCVAPANIDVAAFLENLTNSGLCEDLRLDYAKEKVADGAVMREFEVAFRINLNCEGDAQ